nr:hypothetical protein [Methanobrevibacter arboriphilus]
MLNYNICSNLSASTLQIGQLFGGFGLLHKYPQTLHLHTGNSKLRDETLSLFD